MTDDLKKKTRLDYNHYEELMKILSKANMECSTNEQMMWLQLLQEQLEAEFPELADKYRENLLSLVAGNVASTKKCDMTLYHFKEKIKKCSEFVVYTARSNKRYQSVSVCVDDDSKFSCVELRDNYCTNYYCMTYVDFFYSMIPNDAEIVFYRLEALED